MYKFGIFGMPVIFVFQYVKLWIFIFYYILKDLNFDGCFLNLKYFCQTSTEENFIKFFFQKILYGK